MRVPALSSHASQVVPVQNHANHPVLELLGDDVIKDDVQDCAEVHQERGEDRPCAEPPVYAFPQQAEHQAHVKRHKTHQHLDDECDDNPDGLLLDFGFEFRGAAVDQIVHDDDIAADHYADGNEEEKDESHKVDRVVVAHEDDVLHLDAGGEVRGPIRVLVGEEQGRRAAQGHDPHPNTGHHSLRDVPQLLAVLRLDNGHVAVSAYEGEQPQSHARVENGEGCHDSAEEISKGPVVLVVVNHPERK